MESRRMNRWYFGGLSATSAAICTHPLDLLKTVVQTPNVKAANAVAQSKACHSTIFYAYSAQGYKINPARAFSGSMVLEQKVKLGLVRQTVLIVRTGGVSALYNGLQASMLRQMFHSTTRYGIYEILKQKKCPHGERISLIERIAMATFSGTLGGIVGTPPDVVKIRMQNDVKLPRKLIFF
jgi:dicarboxylate transporter 10